MCIHSSKAISVHSYALARRGLNGRRGGKNQNLDMTSNDIPQIQTFSATTSREYCGKHTRRSNNLWTNKAPYCFQTSLFFNLLIKISALLVEGLIIDIEPLMILVEVLLIHIETLIILIELSIVLVKPSLTIVKMDSMILNERLRAFVRLLILLIKLLIISIQLLVTLMELLVFLMELLVVLAAPFEIMYDLAQLCRDALEIICTTTRPSPSSTTASCVSCVCSIRFRNIIKHLN